MRSYRAVTIDSLRREVSPLSEIGFPDLLETNQIVGDDIFA